MSAPTHPLLIVDDEAGIRLTLSEALTSAGFEVVTAADGEEALRKAEGGPFALMLLDLKMPKKSGMDVLREMIRYRPDVPVVMITAHADVETAVEAVRQGALHFITKPFSPEEIRAVVRQALDRPAQAEAAQARYEQRLDEARGCIRDGRLDTALAHAREALALDATRPEAFNLMGVAKQLRARLEEARQHYRSALALAPDYRPAQRNQENLAAPKSRRNLSRYDLGDRNGNETE